MKKFKFRRKKVNYKNIILFVIFIILFILFSMIKLTKSHSRAINYLLKDISKDSRSINLLTSNLNNLLNTFYFKEKSIYVNNNSSPIVYLYNTHNKEKYSDNTSITMATESLKTNLEKLGVKVIKEESNNSEFLDISLDYYNISRDLILKQKERNIAYFIDVHRDSVTDTSITINNKKYAKLLFVLGLDNPNYKENKKVLNKMNKYLNENYPGISKGIYEKSGKGVNGVYNQDLGSNVILLEIGGIDNNYNEVNNSTEIVALMIYHMIGDVHEQSF